MKAAPPLIAVFLAGILAPTLPPAAASAASPLPSEFELDAPSIVMIGDHTVDQTIDTWHNIRGGDRRPAFTMVAGDASQVGQRMVLTDLDSGPICEAFIGPDLLATCTPGKAFDLGEAVPSATVEGEDDMSSFASDDFVLRFGYDNPTIQVDHYDPTTRLARVSGVSQGDTVTVSNSTSLTSARTDPATGAWRAELRVADPTRSLDVTVAVGDLVSRGIAWLPEARLESPEVSATTSGGHATFRITGSSGALATIRDAEGRTRGGTVLADAGTTLSIPSGVHQATFTVTQRLPAGLESPATTVTIHEGVGSPAPSAPVVGTPRVVGDRFSLQIRGEAGSVVRLKTLGGAVVGVKMLPASGNTEVVFPAPREPSAVTVLSAESSREGATSVPALVALPTP